MFFKMLEFHFRTLDSISVTSVAGITAICVVLDRFHNATQKLVDAGRIDINVVVDQFGQQLQLTGIRNSSSSYYLSLPGLYSSILANQKKNKPRKRYIKLLVTYISQPEMEYLYLYKQYVLRMNGLKDNSRSAEFNDALGIDEIGVILVQHGLSARLIGSLERSI